MNHYNNLLTGLEVINKKKESGTIVSVDENYIVVKYASREAKLVFPDCFDGKLTLVDEELQKQMKSLAKDTIEVRKTATAADIASILAAYQEELARKKTDSKTRKPVEKKKLVLGESFDTHHKILNECFGYNYPNYQPAVKRIDETEYLVWFCADSMVKDGQVVSVIGNDWVNSFKGDEIEEYNANYANIPNYAVNDGLKRITFRKELTTDRYIFAGVYEPHYETTDMDHIRRYKRLGVEMDLAALTIIK